MDLWSLYLALLLRSLINDVVVDCWQLPKISERIINTDLLGLKNLQTMKEKASKPSRYKRNANYDSFINCTKLKDEYANCTTSKFWSLDIIKNRTSFCNVAEYSNRTECLNRFLCTEENSCLHIANNLNAKCRNLTNKGPSFEQSVKILDVLCSTHRAQENCILNLTRAYDQLRPKADYKQCNKAKVPCNNTQCSEVLKELKSSVGCCLRSLMDIYSNQETFELSPDVWQRCGQGKPQRCVVELKTTQNAVSPTKLNSTKSTKATSVPITKKPTKKPSTKMSSRLIAGIIIASIIFIVVSYIIIRFVYQRYFRHNKLHFEDYGYSQLKVILDDDDDLYQEEDEDDQLLSAT